MNRWDVKAQYISPSQGYQITWANSLTWDQMRALVDELLATGRYPAMAGTHLDLYRSTGSRAWAARAVAAYREDTKLREEVERRAARLRALDLQMSFEAPPAEASALEDYVRSLVDGTEDPERASDPADEPVIQRLMKAGQNSEYRMAPLVLARDPVVFLGEMPDGVTPLRRRADGGAQ